MGCGRGGASVFPDGLGSEERDFRRADHEAVVGVADLRPQVVKPVPRGAVLLLCVLHDHHARWSVRVFEEERVVVWLVL